jgi:hypothetical protein
MQTLKRKRNDCDFTLDPLLDNGKRQKTSMYKSLEEFRIINCGANSKLMAKYLAHACITHVLNNQIRQNTTQVDRNVLTKAKILAYACANKVKQKKLIKSKMTSIAHQAAAKGLDIIMKMKNTKFCVSCESDTCTSKNLKHLHQCTRCKKTLCNVCAPYWYYYSSIKFGDSVHIGWGNYTETISIVQKDKPRCQSCIGRWTNNNNIVLRRCTFEKAKKC